MRDTLAALIERVEQAAGPDGVLDAEIHRAAHPQLHDMIAADFGGWLVGGNHPQPIQVPPYTASLDAAVSLVPEGWGREFWHEPGDKAQANVWPPHRRFPRYTFSGFAATPALALVAVALRARIKSER